jgi:predicted nucleotidyltransferase
MQMKVTQDTASNSLTLEEVLARLAASEAVDGLALFGSRTSDRRNPISDYDVLILVTRPPVNIFQMLTHIDGRMADVVFVRSETADRVLAEQALSPVSATSPTGMFLLKMQAAHIVYDASERLRRIQQLMAHYAQQPTYDWLLPSTDTALYDAWFWQNHSLSHLKRMVRSDDPVYLTAVDLWLPACLKQLCRDYGSIRGLPWQGEKAAIRYLQEHDPGYLARLRECLAETDRRRKIEFYEALVKITLAPMGELWTPGITAVYLDDPAKHSTHLDSALAYWEALLNPTPVQPTQTRERNEERE